ncbi:MAG: hypothetical protein IPN26_00305 [Bacteroidetes bacterium]|nr:hypothetical protein [Bacteroidota bacterium]
MKKSALIFWMAVIICLMACNNKTVHEKVTNRNIDFLNLQIDMPANWEIEKLSLSNTAEIQFKKKGGKESLMLIEEILSDTCIKDPKLIVQQVQSKKGYELIQSHTIKNGVGITYQFQKGKNGERTSKSYWFVIEAKGKCYSVKNKICNDELEFFELEKAAIESIH